MGVGAGESKSAFLKTFNDGKTRPAFSFNTVSLMMKN
jgi:hypothetical protein